MARDHILHKVRTALGRVAGQEPPALSPPLLDATPNATRLEPCATRIAEFIRTFENLAGKAYRVPDPATARDCVAGLLNGATAVASNGPFLAACGILSIGQVRSGFTNVDELRGACAEAAVGITSADYALSNTGTLVMLSSAREARLISLLPPMHIAVIPSTLILASLDELPDDFAGPRCRDQFDADDYRAEPYCGH